MKRKTHEEYVAEVAVTNPNIEVVDRYINNSTNILHRCKIDGNEWYAKPNNILSGRGCPICGDNKKKTHEEYVHQVTLVNEDIEVIGKYVGAHIKIAHRCKIDGYEWMTTPANILSGKGCPRCAGNERYGHYGYIKKVFEINQNIEVIGEYVNNNIPILHRCKIDGYEWKTSPSHILNGQGCPRCNGVERYTQEEYIKRVEKINPYVDVLGTYINANTKILHRCKLDGHEWLAMPHSILNGYGCPKCSITSRGEKEVASWLDKMCISYKPQKIFNNCKDKHVLPFDFYLPDYNVAIEYQGKQHYEPIEYFGGQDGFEYVIRHDRIKKDYCKKNNIPLIAIPYYTDVYEELAKMFELYIAKEVTVA